MGYVYDEVKKQLDLDQKGSKAVWSPNIYRCIIIGADYLFFAYHAGIKTNRIVPLNAENVVGDIQKCAEGKYRGSINNLLQERQLSCLEEVYLDVVYQPYPNIFDVAKYADSIKSNVSRLRYIGYCKTSGDASWMIESYSRDNPIYTLAEDKVKKGLQIQATKVDNPEWYRKFFLRPQYYSADKENGKLAVWFRKNQTRIEGMLAEAEKAKLEQDNMQKLRDIAAIDEQNSKYIIQLAKVLSGALNPDKVNGVISNKEDLKILKDGIVAARADAKGRGCIKGLSQSIFNKLYMGDKTFIIPVFNSFYVFDDEKNAGNFDKKQIMQIYKEKTGFLNINLILDDICYNCLKEYWSKNKIGAKISIMGLIAGNYGDKIEVVPAGRFRDYVAQRSGKPELKNSTAQIPKGYFLYISFLMGTKKIYEELN